MFCPACGRELKKLKALISGERNKRALFGCDSCDYDYVVSLADGSVEMIDRSVARLEAMNLGIHLALMFGPDFRTPAALERLAAKE
jgi:hypothetical protein